MPTNLTNTGIIEKSTIVINAAFTDEDGSAISPETATWTLTTSAGAVVNSKEDEVLSPAASIDIVLSGDDLEILSAADNRIRILTVNATYNSALGNGLPLRDSCTFSVQDLVAVN